MKKKITPGKQRNPFPLLCFLLPFLGYTMFMLFSRMCPFGTSSLLYSDMYHQYYPFFVEFRRAILSGDSLLFNWNLGLGLDYLALIAYYVASPLNLLSLLVPESWLMGLFSMLVPVKLGLAGLFFGMFLQRISPRRDWALPVFSSCYALCAWALGYSWNIMWLDTFALLPLVMLGMVRLLQDRKYLLYTFTLALSILMNYYVGLFTCIFVGLCFLTYEICYCKSGKRFFADLGLMFVFSALAIAMTAFLELPAFLALGNTNSSINRFPTGFALNIADENTWLGLLDAMRQVAGNTTGGIAPTLKEGLPNLYCGVLPLLLCIQFFTTKKFTLREKLCNLGLLVFFMLSFILRQLDYIWHGFHFTNMIPYRFSFLFSFVVLVMAYRAYRSISHFSPWRVILSAVVFLGLLACRYDKLLDPVFLGFNLGFLAIYLAVFFFMVRPKMVTRETEDGPVSALEPLTAEQHCRNHKLLHSYLVGALALEMLCSIVCHGVNFTGTLVTDYPRGLGDTQNVIAYMQDRESGSPYYRAECTHTQSLNDDALNGYSGITLFSSSANVRVTRFMHALGYGAKPTYNRYSFEEASPVSNLFLNLKYMIARNGIVLDTEFFQDVYNMGRVHLLENQAYVPLGFMVGDGMLNLDVEDTGNGEFSFQNSLFSEATGIGEEVYHEIQEFVVSSDEETLTVEQTKQTGRVKYQAKDVAGNVNIGFTVPEDGFVCLQIHSPKRNSLSIFKNSEELYTEKMSLDQMMAVGDCKAGDYVEVAFRTKTDQNGDIRMTAAVLDNDVYKAGAAQLRHYVLDLTEFRNTQVSGVITAPENGLLYTSIPYYDNWHAEIDGMEAEIVPILGAMCGIRLPAGTHTVTFTYENPAFRLGSMVSLGALAVTLVLAGFGRKRGKDEKTR